MKTMEVRVDDNAASTAALDPLLLESGGGAGGGGGGTVTLGKLTVEVTSLSVSWVASGVAAPRRGQLCRPAGLHRA